MTLGHRRLRYRRPAESRRPERAGAWSRSESGFTLIEVLIATVIVVVGLVATAQLLIITASMHQLARTSTDATRLAQRKVDELQRVSWNAADLNYLLGIELSPANTLTQNVANYFETILVDPAVPTSGSYDVRWSVTNGPTGTTRWVTVRAVPSVASVGFLRVRGGGVLGANPTNAVELTTLLRRP